MYIKLLLACFLAFSSLIFQSQAQQFIEGRILDLHNGEVIVGAHIALEGKVEGAISNANGKFSLTTDENLPFRIIIRAVGYNEQLVEVQSLVQKYDILLIRSEDYSIGVVVTAPRVEDVVYSVSKKEETRTESMVTTQKLNLLSLRDIPYSDIYEGLSYLPEVQVNSSSLAFPSLNARGFADAQNWRVVQLVDGVDMIGPGLNYTVGNLIGASEMDLRQIELVAGPVSALYGPNAFNGVLVMNTKSPFDYQGLSAYVKGGMTRQEAGGTHPFTDTGIRLGKKFNDRFAIKINLNYLTATDWTADDFSHHITNSDIPRREELLGRTPDHPNYDAVHRYGDEISVPVDLGNGNTGEINRSGISEQDLLDYQIENIKFNTALYFRITKKIEAIYDYKFAEGDAIIRLTAPFAFRDIRQHLHKLELHSSKSFIRAYYSGENSNNSYALLKTAPFIQTSLKSDSLWGLDYGAAYRGEIGGIQAGDHIEARTYADRNVPGSGSSEFQQLLAATLENPDFSDGGSRFIDKSSFLHIDGNYNLRDEIPVLDLQAGFSYRKYMLNSEGNIFNDGPQGFNGVIPVSEYGIYLQGGKKVLTDKLHFRASLRYDKNQNFDGRLTPRASVLLKLGSRNVHNFRLAVQSGFRNPSAQESYMALDLGGTTLLGGTENNVNMYKFPLGSTNFISGKDIYGQLFTLESYYDFLASGETDPNLLKTANLSFLKQESINTWELGYIFSLKEKAQINLNVYRNIYTNLVSRVTAYSLLADRPFEVFTNISDQIVSFGATASIEYFLPDNFRIHANYALAEYNAEEAINNNPGYYPSFNTPRHRVNIGLSNRNLWKGLGFTLRYRWSDTYIWQSPFGQGMIPSYSLWDGAISLRLEKIKSLIKIGGNNIFQNEYLSVYGAPYTGARYYISFILEEWK